MSNNLTGKKILKYIIPKLSCGSFAMKAASVMA
jgi:hypothetical protein